MICHWILNRPSGFWFFIPRWIKGKLPVRRCNLDVFAQPSMFYFSRLIWLSISAGNTLEKRAGSDLSVYQSIYLSVCLSVCLSIYIYILYSYFKQWDNVHLDLQMIYFPMSSFESFSKICRLNIGLTIRTNRIDMVSHRATHLTMTHRTMWVCICNPIIA